MRMSFSSIPYLAASVFAPHALEPYALLNIRGRHAFYVMGVTAELELGITNALSSTYERIELFPEPGRRLDIGIRVRPGRAGLPRTASSDTVREHAQSAADTTTQEENS